MRIATAGENVIGKVCVCSLGRVGIVAERKVITFHNGDTGEFWTGIGIDGKGLWATSTSHGVGVIAESIPDYCAAILKRPSNLVFGTIAVPAPTAA